MFLENFLSIHRKVRDLNHYFFPKTYIIFINMIFILRLIKFCQTASFAKKQDGLLYSEKRIDHYNNT